MNTNQLAQLIDAKLEVLRQLHAVAERQLQVIREEDISTLLSVLTAKQRVLEVLRQFEEQLAPYLAEDPERRLWSSPAQRTRCREQAARCEALLREVLDLEREAEAAMINRRSEVSGQIRNLDNTAEAGRAYAQSQAVASTSLDLSSEG